MLKYALFVLAITSASFCEERKHKYVDPFTALDRHITHSLAYHYLWPWSQLVRAAAALDAEEGLEEPKIVSDADKLEINLNVKRFKPDELRIKVKNRNIIIEGKHKEKNDEKQFMANHFVQRFVLPLGSKQEEVTAVLKENGILTVSVPKHEVPPPPPEREVPIEVLVSEDKTETPKDVTTEKKIETEASTITTEKKIEPVPSSSPTPLEQLDLIEVTTHVGKIRKKELKDTTKTAKDNEVTKGVDGNGLDYALIDAE